MLNDRLALYQMNAFRRLATLLGDTKPRSNDKPILLSVGEPQNQPPALLADEVARNADKWNRYAGLEGTKEWREAVVGWLNRRYRLPSGKVDPERHVLPMPGSREPIFMAAIGLVPSRKAGRTPAVLVGNPSYHVYAGAAVAAGAEPVYLPATRDNGFLPELDSLPRSELERTALFYLCSPANPQGTVAGLDYLKRAIELARRYDFVLAVDECYAEIYDRVPPPGALEACAALGDGMGNVFVAHSLSKRSSAPGLRSAFVAGPTEIIGRFKEMISYAGAGVSLPTLAAAARLWSDDTHVESNRQIYRDNFDIAERILGGRFGFYRPAAAFYLWLDVGDGEAAAKRLWVEAGIRVLPGAYMGVADSHGTNPGQSYIRVALVYDRATTETALTRLSRVLTAA